MHGPPLVVVMMFPHVKAETCTLFTTDGPFQSTVICQPCHTHMLPLAFIRVLKSPAVLGSYIMWQQNFYLQPTQPVCPLSGASSAAGWLPGQLVPPSHVGGAWCVAAHINIKEQHCYKLRVVNVRLCCPSGSSPPAWWSEGQRK